MSHTMWKYIWKIWHWWSLFCVRFPLIRRMQCEKAGVNIWHLPGFYIYKTDTVNPNIRDWVALPDCFPRIFPHVKIQVTKGRSLKATPKFDRYTLKAIGILPFWWFWRLVEIGLMVRPAVASRYTRTARQTDALIGIITPWISHIAPDSGRNV